MKTEDEQKNSRLIIAICDDNDTDAAYVASLVEVWAKKAAEKGTYCITGKPLIRRYPSAEAFLFDYEDHPEVDILLLDIEMKEMDGVSLAKKIRGDNETVQIIFITGFSEYIADGYDVSALHYLMKPVSADKLMEVLDRAVLHLEKSERVLNLHTGDGLTVIPFRNVLCLEAQRNYVYLRMLEDTVTVRSTLSSLEAELDDRFYRCGRSYIINLDHIRSVARSEIRLSDGTLLPLPRGQYEPLNRAIINRS